MSPAAAFFQFWWTDLTRDAFLASLPKEDLLSMRLVCHDFAYRTAPVLFKEVDVEFRNGTFTRPARMAALERIGNDECPLVHSRIQRHDFTSTPKSVVRRPSSRAPLPPQRSRLRAHIPSYCNRTSTGKVSRHTIPPPHPPGSTSLPPPKHGLWRIPRST
ncbi:conserved hypothetical protein [Histoplasma capsulatum H143]|uniref:F-box domain-containing protein n=1 Tax=Ajellomyces capsulatus (strain H143) TaxID=544712 RepID=C6H6G5_AJECH|nr:conserved hypothetical protein [Histoplasma capsulatum H143]